MGGLNKNQSRLSQPSWHTDTQDLKGNMSWNFLISQSTFLYQDSSSACHAEVFSDQLLGEAWNLAQVSPLSRSPCYEASYSCRICWSRQFGQSWQALCKTGNWDGSNRGNLCGHPHTMYIPHSHTWHQFCKQETSSDKLDMDMVTNTFLLNKGKQWCGYSASRLDQRATHDDVA